jgi:predicted dehydrogenase
VAVRAIRAGKHVLVEKPSTSNATEAEILFNLPELSKDNGPVLLEAFHSRFYPAWAFFRSLINPANVVHVSTTSMLPWWATSKDDIYFNYSLSGGCIMALGTYSFAAMRLIFDAEPEECLSCDVKAGNGAHKGCDYGFKAKFRFPNGGIGEAQASIKDATFFTPSSATVTEREVMTPDDTLPASQEMVQSRELTLHGFIHGVFWNRIDIKDVFVIRSKGGDKMIKKWEEKKSHNVYTFKEAGGKFENLPSEIYWMSFRHQLEQFVNRIKGRETQEWVSGEDSINQMKMLDMAYEKSGLGLRPISTYR